MKEKGKSESEILKESLKLLKELGIYCWRQNTGAFKTQGGGFFRSSMAGVADIIGILPNGRFIAVECKREKGGVLSEKQKEFLENIDKNKGLSIVCNDVQNLEKIMENILENIKKSID